MVVLGNTLSPGDTLSLVQAQKGVRLRQLVGASGSLTDIVDAVIDGAGTQNYSLALDGTIISKGPITATTITPTTLAGSGVAGAASGSLPGLKAPIISGLGATRTLLATESGSTVLFDRAAGIVITLPVPAVGLTYDFITTVSRTGGAYEVDTDAGTTFILGSIVNIKTDLTTLFCLANGTSIVKISSNGTTTGGLLGGRYRLTCVSATVWQIDGTVLGSGTIATPFA